MSVSERQLVAAVLDWHEGVKLGWLAGVFDGEGSVILSRDTTMPGRPRIAASCAIQMTHETTIRRIAELLDERAIGYYLNVDVRPQRPEHAPIYYIRVNRQHEILRFVAALTEWCVTKRPQLTLMGDYIAHRISAPRGRGARLTDVDWSYVERMRELNRRGA